MWMNLPRLLLQSVNSSIREELVVMMKRFETCLIIMIRVRSLDVNSFQCRHSLHVNRIER